jgi:hypothetical protein
MIDGSRKLTVEFEVNPESGKCLTPCPYGRDCMVHSLVCESCGHFFGLVDGSMNIIKCTGARVGNE